MLRRALFFAVLLIAACSPPPEPQPPKVVVPPPQPKPAPEQTHARWLSVDAVGTPAAQIDLGDKGSLQVGRGGRRWRIAKDGTVEASPYLLPGDLADARSGAGKLFLLGKEGVVYVVDDPLGPPQATRPSPSNNAKYVAGRDALLGVETDGTLRRSTDGGVTWKESKLPLTNGDRVESLAANARGEVLVLVLPQRVLASTDDGATFAVVATPGIGATTVDRDANGDLFLRSQLVAKDAKLLTSPARLEVATTFAELKAPQTPKKALPKGDWHKQLVGTRVVTVNQEADPTSKRVKIDINVQPLAGGDTPSYVLAASASQMTRVRLAGHDNIVVATVYDPDADPRGVKLFRTTDDGKNWEPLGLVEGVEGTNFRVGVAPEVIVIGAMCGAAPPCMPPRIKVGNKDWQSLGVAAGARFGTLNYDAGRDRLFVSTTEDTGYFVYAAKRGEKLKKLDAKLGSGVPHASTVDDDGTLRIAFGTPWRIEKIGADLKRREPTFLPFTPKTIDLASSRGLAWRDDRSWETADGGEHWAAVAVGARGTLACAATGCLQGTAVRLGWDLPNPAATLIPAPTKAHWDDDPEKPAPTRPAPAPLRLECKTTGPWKSYAGTAGADETAYDGDVRFIASAHDNADGALRSVTVIRGTAAPTPYPLLPASPKESATRSVRHWSQFDPQGAIGARFSFSTVPPKDPDPDGTKKYNPVDVELAWYSAKTGKVHKASLPQLKPFRVGRSSPSALMEIVDGGLLFLPLIGETPFYFINNAGKAQALPRPPEVATLPYNSGFKNGNQLVLAQSTYEDAVLVATNDLGKTWTSTVWSTGVFNEVISFEGKPALLLGARAGEMYGTTGMIPLAALTPDPPPAFRWKLPLQPFAGDKLTACSKPAIELKPTYEDDPRQLHVVVSGESEPLTLFANSAPMRGAPDGTTCTQAIAATYDGDSASYHALVSTSDPAHGWLTKSTEPEKFQARPISCTLP